MKEKELPKQLQLALMIQSELIEPPEEISKEDAELKSYHINQRNEVVNSLCKQSSYAAAVFFGGEGLIWRGFLVL